MGPSYANLFVGFIESKFFFNYHGPKPDLYKRYIDDCVGATSSSREELNQFINSVNSFHPALKYTWKISENSLVFLDIKLSINDNGLSTSVHYKPTDSHNYLLHSSSHPQHVKNAISFSQFHRQTPRPRNRPRDRTTNFTEQRNRQNSIHPYLPSTKHCYQKCYSKKLQNFPQ